MTPEQCARLPWDPLTPVVIPGTTLRIGGSIDRIDLAAAGDMARVTDYKSGKPPRHGSEPIVKGGAELQRCLYAFAVRSLLPGVSSISSRLLYPKGADGGLYSLADPEGEFTFAGKLYGPGTIAYMADPHFEHEMHRRRAGRSSSCNTSARRPAPRRFTTAG
jgi:hypothetical protein